MNSPADAPAPVSLRDVTRENFQTLVMLKGVPGDGYPPLFEPSVASIAFSITQAYAEPEWRPRAVYAGEAPVGFGMWGLDRELDAPFVTRLLIDHRRQRLGYGRRAMALMLEEIAATGAREAYVSIVEGNGTAEALYRSLGFSRTGRTVGFGAHQEPLLHLAF
ncbi:GNAT family N-acetyltransferase [Salinarimonas sp.]|uniref:GNAT family N-acetyltransferase n=1 Tax=Salinarimonas sp. TaxID=2766526 RepID=UPI0032D98781